MVQNKKELFQKTLDAVNARINRYEKEMEMIRESMDANDIKTDYDEDNRGKLLGDFEKNAEFLNQGRQMKETLSTLDLEHYSEEVNLGSVVETDKNYYFVSVPVGKLEMEDGSSVYAISTEAPIYRVMEGKKAGENFNFNDETIEIKEVH